MIQTPEYLNPFILHFYLIGGCKGLYILSFLIYVGEALFCFFAEMVLLCSMKAWQQSNPQRARLVCSLISLTGVNPQKTYQQHKG
jgi:hypothetical protein